MTEASKLDLVLEGGGVKGVGLVGAVSVLVENGYVPENIAGTSVGAIVATLLGAGYSTEDIRKILIDLDFRKLTDTSKIGSIPLIGPAISVATGLGICKGDYLLGLMRELLGAKGKHTFRDLVMPEYANDERCRYKVRVIASDITRGRLLCLPQDIAAYGMAPDDLEIALAVRMSMSIPYFFRPVKLPRPGGQASYIVDGGLLSNFPMSLFDAPGIPSWPTFGVQLVGALLNGSGTFNVRGPLSMLRAIVGTALQAHDLRYIETHDFVRTIPVQTTSVGPLDFDLSHEKKEALYAAGAGAARAFLSTWDFEDYKARFRSGKPELSRRELVQKAA